MSARRSTLDAHASMLSPKSQERVARQEREYADFLQEDMPYIGPLMYGWGDDSVHEEDVEYMGPAYCSPDPSPSPSHRNISPQPSSSLPTEVGTPGGTPNRSGNGCSLSPRSLISLIPSYHPA